MGRRLGSLAPSGEIRRAGREEEKARAREEDTSCDINKDNIITETGLVLIDAGCRKEERGRRVGKGRGIHLCLLLYKWLGSV